MRMYMAKPAQASGGNHLVMGRDRSSDISTIRPPPPPLVPQATGLTNSNSIQSSKFASSPQPFDRDKLLSEVRTGLKLRHVVPDDRSAPIGVGKVSGGGISSSSGGIASSSSARDERSSSPLPPPPVAPPVAPVLAVAKANNDKPPDRERLLFEVRSGVQLRKVVTNDRSAPIGVGRVCDEPSMPLNSDSIPPTVAPPPPPPPLGITPLVDATRSPSPRPPSKPVTNPALKKLGGKEPVEIDRLLASIREGIQLRKVETHDCSAPVGVGRVRGSVDNIEERRRSPPVSRAATSPPPPPPPPQAPPPPPAPSLALPGGKGRTGSKTINPALLKLGGKPTVDRDDFMRSIRAGVKLRKTVVNDRSGAILNDDDFNVVKSSGRSTPSTSNEYDDAYGSSFSDLDSVDTSRFSSLSNILEQRVNDKSTTIVGSSPQYIVSQTSEAQQAAVAQNADGSNRKQSSEKPPIRRLSSTEKIPAGSASDRIKLFDNQVQSAAWEPLSGHRQPSKTVRKTGVDEKETVSKGDSTNENSIRKMVRKFSIDDEANITSQPIWYQKQRTGTEPTKMRRTEDGASTSKQDEVLQPSNPREKKVTRTPSKSKTKKLSVSKKEPISSYVTDKEEKPKYALGFKDSKDEKAVKTPGRVKKPSWLNDIESVSSGEVPSWKKSQSRSAAIKHVGDAPQPNESDRRKNEMTESNKYYTAIQVQMCDDEALPPVPDSSPPELLSEPQETATYHGRGPYRYMRRESSGAGRTATSSIGDTKSQSGTKQSMFNSTPKPFISPLTTTGRTTTIEAKSSIRQKTSRGSKSGAEPGDGSITDEKKKAVRSTKTNDSSDRTTTVYAVPILAPWYKPELYRNGGENGLSGTNDVNLVTSNGDIDYTSSQRIEFCARASLGHQGVGRAHRVLVGDTDPICGTHRRLSPFRMHSPDRFRESFRFEIDIDNDQQPLKIVQR